MATRLATALILLTASLLLPSGGHGGDEAQAADHPPFRGKIVLFGAMRAPRTSPVGEIIRMNPDGSELESLDKLEGVAYMNGRISPEGRRLALGILNADGNRWETWIWEAGERRRLPLEGGEVRAWAPDGHSILCFRWADTDQGTWQNLRVNVRAGTEQDLRLPKADVIEDWSPDAKHQSVMAGNRENAFEHEGKGTYPLRQIDLLQLSDGKRQRITRDPLSDNIWSRFSPDGSKVAHYQRRHEGRKAGDKVFEYYVVFDRKEEKTIELLRPYKLDEELREVESFPSYPWYWTPRGPPCWSFDGSQIAMCLDNGKWRGFHNKPLDAYRFAIVFCTPTGRIVNRLDLQKLGILFLTGMDWQ